MTVPSDHPWKTLLRRARRKLIRTCAATAVPWDGFDVPAGERRFTEDGERVWASYGVGIVGGRPWWEARFADTKILVRGPGGQAYDIPYAELYHVELGLNLKTEPLSEVILEGLHFRYQRAVIQGHDGGEYEVWGAVVAGGRISDIWQWHTVVGGAWVDRERAGVRALTEIASVSSPSRAKGEN